MSVASSLAVGPRKRSSVGMTSLICDTPFAYMLRSMRSEACVSVSLTEDPEFFDCDQGFAEVFELDFHEPLCGNHGFACLEMSMFAAPLGRTRDLCSRTHDLGSRTHDLCSRTHNLGSRTHDLGSRTLDLGSRTHDLGSISLSDPSRTQVTVHSVLCRSRSVLSKGLKVAGMV